MVDYTIIQNLQDLDIDSSKPCFCDTETDGLYGDILLFQVCQDSKVYIIHNPCPTELIEWVCEHWTVWYNASYDLACIYHNSGKAVPTKLFSCVERVDDLLYMAKQTFLGLDKYSLDNVMEYVGIPLYSNIDKKAMQKSFKAGLLTPEQYEYAATDVIALEKLWDKCQVVVDNFAYKLNIKSMLYALDYQENGIPIDLPAVAQKLLDTNLDIEANDEKLDFNVNSPKQCKEVLGTDSSDTETLKHLIAEGNDTAQLIYDQRRLLKRKVMLETYMFPRVYTRFNVAGAVSSRFSATGQGIEAGINAQQIPRDLKYLFRNPESDMVIIEADYSTLELRLAAALFGDAYMYKQLMNGEDLHTSMAQKMTGRKDITKDERTKAKAINFGFVFGMSAKTFVDYAFLNYGSVFTYDEALEIRNTYFDMYRNIAQHHRYIWENYKKPGFYVQTALGWKVKPKLGTDGINIPVQGSGAECTKLAIHYFVKDKPVVLKHIVNVVHDSIMLEVPKEQVDDWKEKLEYYMLKAWTELGKSNSFKYKDIPMLVDISVKE
jgi:DNA polymerase I-like protein with 3'-5' exonuclease and polymerase domains